MAEPKVLQYATFLRDFKNVLTSYDGRSHKNLCLGLLCWLDGKHYIPYNQSEFGQPQAEAMVNLFILAHGLLRYLTHDRNSQKLRVAVNNFLQDRKKTLPAQINKFIIQRFLNEARSTANDLYQGSDEEYYNELEKLMNAKTTLARKEIQNIANAKQPNGTASDLPLSPLPNYSIFSIDSKTQIFLSVAEYKNYFSDDCPLQKKLCYDTCVKNFVDALKKYSPDKEAKHSWACRKLITEINQRLLTCYPKQQDKQLLKFLRVVFALWNYLKNNRNSKHLFPLVDGYLRDLLPYVPQPISAELMKNNHQPIHTKSKEESYIEATFSGKVSQLLFSAPPETLLSTENYTKFFDDALLSPSNIFKLNLNAKKLTPDLAKIELDLAVTTFLSLIKEANTSLTERRQALAALMGAEQTLRTCQSITVAGQLTGQSAIFTTANTEPKYYQSLAGKDLSASNLSELKFDFFSFVGTNFTSANMRSCDFSNCDFTGANINNVEIDDILFTDCCGLNANRQSSPIQHQTSSK